MTAKKKTTKSKSQKKPVAKVKKAKAAKKASKKKTSKAKKNTTSRTASSSSSSKKASSKKKSSKVIKASTPKSKKPPAVAAKKGGTGSKKAGSTPAAKKAEVEKQKPKLTAAQKQKLVEKIHSVLKGHYSPQLPNTTRPLLEQVLFACCLENSHYDDAEKAFANLMENAFDLNEIRVTTVAELADLLVGLPDASRAALSLRRVLQSVFESTYSFSLEHAKKHSVSHGVKTLENLRSLTPFTKVFVTSTALGGHGVPLDHGAITVLYLSGMVSFEEYEQVNAPGLDRMVTKKIGKDFSSLLHQFGADLLSSLHGVKSKKILGEIAADVKERMPKRGEKLPEPLIAALSATSDGDVSEQHRPAGPQAAPRPAGKTPQPPPGSGPKRDADGTPIGTRSGPKPFVVKPNKARSITIKPELAAQREAAEREAQKAKSGAKKARKSDSKPTGKKSASAKKTKTNAKQTPGHSRKLAKKKPR
ncbi:MAG: hypothetical protein ACPGMQ_04790 [Pirellulales bacterium]